MGTPKLVTRESLIKMLQHPNPKYVEAVIGRALVVLYERQSREEQQSHMTSEHNGVGFTQADARTGTRSAEIYLKTGKLLPWVVEAWTKPNVNGVPRIVKYWKQLNEAAVEKASQ